MRLYRNDAGAEKERRAPQKRSPRTIGKTKALQRLDSLYPARGGSSSKSDKRIAR